MIKIMLSPGIIRITVTAWSIPEGIPCYYSGELIYPLRTTGHKIKSICGFYDVESLKDWMTEQIKAVKSQL